MQINAGIQIQNAKCLSADVRYYAKGFFGILI
jgi:hypothetical protein